MKKLLSVVALAFLLASLSTAEAQDMTVEVAPRLGYDLGDLEELFIGAEGRFYVEDLPVVLSPAFDYYFTSSDFEGTSLNVFGIDLNALYEFELEDSAITPYAGAGIGIIRVSASGTVEGFSVSSSSTETGINLLGGAIFTIDAPVRPFAQAKTNIGSDFTLFSLMGGILIEL
ncbi:MAG: outer membrane beta-barrel protein [Bacteroidetes bacterium]|jgi:opacity protein-like surface antigen|nr:outer membrane beta-barrel protein [Bacteroidota bacterium]